MKKGIHIVFLLLVALSCTKETFTITNLNNNSIDAMGHAGMGFSDIYPINSLESISNCLSVGATGTEMDVQMTRDSVLVAFHDPTLESSTTLTGIIHEHTYEELKSGYYLNAPYAMYEIVSLREIMDAIGNYGDYVFTFDIKLITKEIDYNGYMNTFKNRILAFFADYQLESHAYIESQNADFLSIMKASNPNIGLYHYPQTYEDGIAVASGLAIKGISISNDKINSEQVAEAHGQGFFVTIWGVNSKQENEDAIRKNPDMIQSDKIEHLIKILE